jgi:hypothetical protein
VAGEHAMNVGGRDRCGGGGGHDPKGLPFWSAFERGGIA